MNEKKIARFWSKVDKSAGSDGCWIWTGYRTHQNYGRATIDGRCEQAHRWSFFLTFGHWPRPFGCHHCDNPPCVNPLHIFEGTAAANMADMVAKGRNKHVRPVWVPRGETHHLARLNPVLVKQIRALHGTVSYVEIARLYGVSEGAVNAVINRRSWKHVA